MTNFKVVEAMQVGSSCAMNILRHSENGIGVGVEHIDGIMDDIRDTMDYAAEVNEILSRPVENVIMVDDDELLREVQALRTGYEVVVQ
jgi:hypothetical protein